MALIEGTPDSDLLVGSDLGDRIYGFQGNDTLDGLDGDDRLYGGAGDDLIRTGYGNDSAWGGAGNDTLRGGGAGDQVLDGGAGHDWILLGIDRTFGNAGFSTGYGGDGNDLLQIAFSDSGAMFGGNGTDTARLVVYSTLFGQTTVSLTGGMVNSNGQTVSFDSIERLQFFADFGDHTVTGGDLADEIFVGGGADSVSAGGGDDMVGYRLLGAHTLDGGAGNDLLVVEGLIGQPVYFIVGGDGAVDDGGLSQITGFERYHVYGQGLANDIIALGVGNDTAEGFRGNDTLLGRAGDDVLAGGSGNDSLDGGAGRDTMRGDSGDDTLYGGAGNDLLRGGTGADVLFGGAGRDRLIGGTGDDTLLGGAGADTFVFDDFDQGLDLIADFAVGLDQLRMLSFYFGDAVAGGYLALGAVDPARFAEGMAQTGQAQFVRSYQSGPDQTWLLWDADGTGAVPATVVLKFTGDIALSAADLWII